MNVAVLLNTVWQIVCFLFPLGIEAQIHKLQYGKVTDVLVVFKLICALGEPSD